MTTRVYSTITLLRVLAVIVSVLVGTAFTAHKALATDPPISQVVSIYDWNDVEYVTLTPSMYQSDGWAHLTDRDGNEVYAWTNISAPSGTGGPPNTVPANLKIPWCHCGPTSCVISGVQFTCEQARANCSNTRPCKVVIKYDGQEEQCCFQACHP
jgi:hypothetical protein